MHLFGYAIVVECDKEDQEKITAIYPARVSWRGFNQKDEAAGFTALTCYLESMGEELVTDLVDEIGDEAYKETAENWDARKSELLGREEIASVPGEDKIIYNAHARSQMLQGSRRAWEAEEACNCELRDRKWNPNTGRCENCGKKYDKERG